MIQSSSNYVHVRNYSLMVASPSDAVAGIMALDLVHGAVVSELVNLDDLHWQESGRIRDYSPWIWCWLSHLPDRGRDHGACPGARRCRLGAGQPR